MSKKNSNVILKNGFEDYDNLSKIFFNFKQKILSLKKKTFIVAVSGGPDSLALAALTKALSFQKKIKFFYILINHNIRKNSLKEAENVKTLLKKHNINLKIFSNKKKITKNIQNNARIIRYKIISKFSSQKKVNHILTAHNLEDQVETFFIRLSRGSGLTGLSSMREHSILPGNLILFRPLLSVKKKKLVSISKIIFGRYFNDPSNKNKKYLRTKVRSLQKPLIQSGINYDQIIKSINNLAASQATLDQYYSGISKKIIKKSKKLISINFRDFKTLNLELKIRIINDSIKILKKNYYNPRSKKVINLLKKFEDNRQSKATLSGCIFEKTGHLLKVKKEKK